MAANTGLISLVSLKQIVPPGLENFARAEVAPRVVEENKLLVPARPRHHLRLQLQADFNPSAIVAPSGELPNAKVDSAIIVLATNRED